METLVEETLEIFWKEKRIIIYLNLCMKTTLTCMVLCFHYSELVMLMYMNKSINLIKKKYHCSISTARLFLKLIPKLMLVWHVLHYQVTTPPPCRAVGCEINPYEEGQFIQLSELVYAKLHFYLQCVAPLAKIRHGQND